MTKSQLNKIKQAIEHHEGFRNAYFWTPLGNASRRRQMEEREHRDIKFKHQGVEYRYICDIDCSCRNVYVDSRFLVDGERKTVRAFRKLLPKEDS